MSNSKGNSVARVDEALEALRRLVNEAGKAASDPRENIAQIAAWDQQVSGTLTAQRTHIEDMRQRIEALEMALRYVWMSQHIEDAKRVAWEALSTTDTAYRPKGDN